MRTTTIAAASDKATILRWVVRPAPRSEWCIAVFLKSRSSSCDLGFELPADTRY
jgi:hypothetical protein